MADFWNFKQNVLEGYIFERKLKMRKLKIEGNNQY